MSIGWNSLRGSNAVNANLVSQGDQPNEACQLSLREYSLSRAATDGEYPLASSRTNSQRRLHAARREYEFSSAPNRDEQKTLFSRIVSETTGGVTIPRKGHAVKGILPRHQPQIEEVFRRLLS
ncbi:MAG: hypothetical protein JWM11_3277 [Planctomycetaceae bacterium]|nr:hypothetical protein [Planctomycetaceae bacterium]